MMMMHDDACLMFSETIEKLRSIIVYDEVYNDVNEQCMVVKWIISI